MVADMISLSIRLQPFPPFVAFEALGGVDDAAECRRAVEPGGGEREVKDEG